MDRFSGSGDSPAVFVAVALLALQSNELGFRASRLERRRDPLTLRDVHIVIAGSMHRENRNVGSRKRYCGDVAKLGVGHGAP